MTRFTIRAAALAATTTTIAMGAFVATGVGADGKAPTADRVAASKQEYRRLPAREASFARAGRSGALARAASASGLKVKYVWGTATVPSGEFFGGILGCPKSAPKAIGGGFDSASPVVLLAASRPDGAKGRDWAVGVTNLGTTDANVEAVVVCAK